MGTAVRKVTGSVVCLSRASYLTCSYTVRTENGQLVDAGLDSYAADVNAGAALCTRPWLTSNPKNHAKKESDEERICRFTTYSDCSELRIDNDPSC